MAAPNEESKNVIAVQEVDAAQNDNASGRMDTDQSSSQR